MKDFINAHKYSSKNKDKLLTDNQCGCFYCLTIFKPSEISDWFGNDKEEIALCPYCGIDSIIGAGIDRPITKEFLKRMKKSLFENSLEF